ncbi:MAG: PLDc N-terminal domain-containing protein [Deltaproteobacteria bacterium]|nr:MAG: PLDc N-terminal domain-containing protein [Deltaproteobacteria bacterium]
MDLGVVLRILLLVGIAVLLFIPTFWSIRDVAYRSFPSFKTKVVWFAVVTLLPPVGGMVYFLIGRDRNKKGSEPRP